MSHSRINTCGCPQSFSPQTCISFIRSFWFGSTRCVVVNTALSLINRSVNLVAKDRKCQDPMGQCQSVTATDSVIIHPIDSKVTARYRNHKKDSDVISPTNTEVTALDTPSSQLMSPQAVYYPRQHFFAEGMDELAPSDEDTPIKKDNFRVLQIVPRKEETVVDDDDEDSEEEHVTFDSTDAVRFLPQDEESVVKKKKSNKEIGPLDTLKYRATVDNDGVIKAPLTARNLTVQPDEEVTTDDAVRPSTVSNFQRLQLQQQVNENQKRRQQKASKLEDRAADVDEYRKLWKEFKKIQVQADSTSLPGTKPSSDSIASDDNSVLSLQETGSWFFDFQNFDFTVQDLPSEVNANAFTEATLRIQRELFRRKRRERKFQVNEPRGVSLPPISNPGIQPSPGVSIAGQRFVAAPDIVAPSPRDYGARPARLSNEYRPSASTPRIMEVAIPERGLVGDGNSVISDLEDSVSVTDNGVRRRAPRRVSTGSAGRVRDKIDSIESKLSVASNREPSILRPQERLSLRSLETIPSLSPTEEKPSPASKASSTIEDSPVSQHIAENVTRRLPPLVTPANNISPDSPTVQIPLAPHPSSAKFTPLYQQHHTVCCTDETPPMSNTSSKKHSDCNSIIEDDEETVKELEMPTLDQTADEDDMESLLHDVGSKEGGIPIPKLVPQRPTEIRLDPPAASMCSPKPQLPTVLPLKPLPVNDIHNSSVFFPSASAMEESDGESLDAFDSIREEGTPVKVTPFVTTSLLDPRDDSSYGSSSVSLAYSSRSDTAGSSVATRISEEVSLERTSFVSENTHAPTSQAYEKQTKAPRRDPFNSAIYEMSTAEFLRMSEDAVEQKPWDESLQLAERVQNQVQNVLHKYRALEP